MRFSYGILLKTRSKTQQTSGRLNAISEYQHIGQQVYVPFFHRNKLLPK